MMKRYVLVILSIILICSSKHPSIAQDIQDMGKEDGEIYGYLDGYIDALKADEEKNKTSSKFILPRQSEILIKYKDKFKEKNTDYLENFYSGYKDGYNRGYREVMRKERKEKADTDIKMGIHDGKMAAGLYGSMSGETDYFENRYNDYNRSLPTENKIVRIYSLDRESKRYRKAFLLGFKEEYENKYADTFRKTNLSYNSKLGKSAYEHGRLGGLNDVSILAKEDYGHNLFDNNRVNRIDNSRIYREYNLFNRPEIYIDYFLAGYDEGFTYGYIDTYGDLIKEELSKKVVTDNIPIEGGKLVSGDGIVFIDIKSGTYCDSKLISIERLYDDLYKIDNPRYIQASGIYNIKDLDQVCILNPNKPIELSFSYYGKEDGGIYKLWNGEWIYVNSKIGDDKISTYINPETLKGDKNIYCVLIDSKFTPIIDTPYHWARYEINTFLRRGIIAPDEKGRFFPNGNITYLEIVNMIKRIYGDKLVDNLAYIDMEEGRLLSYNDIERIMSAVLDDVDFRWKHISEKILYEKQIKSRSYINMDNKITKAEVVYMFYNLYKWRH